MTISSKILTRCILVITLLSGLWLTLSRPVRAESNNGIEVSPAFQEVILPATAATAAGQISVTNRTAQDQVFTLFALDIRQFDSEGRVVFTDRPLSGQSFTLADFIQVSSQAAVPAGRSQVIPFSIRNSADLQPGGHYSALIVRGQASAANTQKEVLPAVSSFILVRKEGGERYQLSLLEHLFLSRTVLWRLPNQVTLTFSNQGNVHQIPRGTVTVTDVFGRLTQKGIINENSLYVFPGSQRPLPVTLSATTWSWPVMIYRVSITVTAPPSEQQLNSQTMVVVIQPGIILGLLTVTLLTLLAMRRRLNSKRRKTHATA